MKVYIITMVLVTALDLLVKLYSLGGGVIRRRTPMTVAIDAGFAVIFIVWGAVVLGDHA